MAARLPYVDNLKGLLILLVVIGHLNAYIDVSACPAASTLSNFIYTFHMPLFLFCSGLFVRRSFEKGRWEGQMASVLVFILLYLLFFLATWIVLAACGSTPKMNPMYMTRGSWYLFVLACMLLVSPMLSRLRFGWALGIALALSVGNCIFSKDPGFLASSRFFTYLPCFVCGYFCTGARLTAWREKLRPGASSSACGDAGDGAARGSGGRRWVLAAGGACLVLVLYFLALLVFLPDKLVGLERALSTGQHTAADIEWVFGLGGWARLAALAACRLLHYLLVALLGVAVCVLCPMRACFLTKWGRNSLQVYIVHLLLLYAVDALCGLDAVAAFLGVGGCAWTLFFPVLGGFALTALLALPPWPNTWLAALKRSVARIQSR